MVCSSVHAERPSCSTSGGQSAGGCRDEVACAGGVVTDTVDGEVEEVEEVVVLSLVMAAQDANDVHDRHLKPLALAHNPCTNRHMHPHTHTPTHTHTHTRLGHGSLTACHPCPRPRLWGLPWAQERHFRLASRTSSCLQPWRPAAAAVLRLP